MLSRLTKLPTLKKRAEFQRVRGGGRVSLPNFVIEGKKRPAIQGNASPGTHSSKTPTGRVGVDGPRFGLTITRKIGNAVTRNRIRRRLKAALVVALPDSAAQDMDYVIIVRSGLAELPFSDLVGSLRRALTRVSSNGRGREGKLSPS